MRRQRKAEFEIVRSDDRTSGPFKSAAELHEAAQSMPDHQNDQGDDGWDIRVVGCE